MNSKKRILYNLFDRNDDTINLCSTARPHAYDEHGASLVDFSRLILL